MAIPYPGELAAAGTTLCWAVSVLSFDAAGRRIGSMVVNIIRLALALCMLSGLAYVVRGRALPDDAPAHAWLYLSLSGAVGFFLGDLCLFRSFLLLGPRLAALLMSLAPPLTVVAGMALLDEHLTPQQLGGMGITLAGVIWVILERPVREMPAHRAHKVTPWGLLLGLLAAGGQGLGMVLAKKGMILADGSMVHPLAATQIRALAGVTGFALLFIALRWHGPLIKAFREGRAIGITALGAFFGPVLGVSLALLSMQYISSAVTQTIAATLPIVIIPPVVLIHKEHVSLRAVGGAIVAFAGVAVLLG